MLPGETLQVALGEPAHHALLLEALHRRHGPLDKGCFGQLLKRDHDRASSITPLLQITRRCRRGPRLDLDRGEVRRARARRPFDQSPDVLRRGLRARSSTGRRRRPPTAATPAPPPPPATAMRRRRWRRRRSRGGVGARRVRRAQVVAAHAARRRAPSRLRWARDSATCSASRAWHGARVARREPDLGAARARDGRGAGAGARGHPALRWGAESEESAERQVESFAAFHFLGAQERYAALACDDTLRRYGIALRALGRCSSCAPRRRCTARSPSERRRACLSMNRDVCSSLDSQGRRPNTRCSFSKLREDPTFEFFGQHQRSSAAEFAVQAQ